MAEGVEAEHEWSDWALDTAGNSVMAVETLLATLRAFEDVLRQQEISVASSTEYCDNFCQVTLSCNTDASCLLAHPHYFFSRILKNEVTCDGCCWINGFV